MRRKGFYGYAGMRCSNGNSRHEAVNTGHVCSTGKDAEVPVGSITNHRRCISILSRRSHRLTFCRATLLSLLGVCRTASPGADLVYPISPPETKTILPP